MAKPRHIYAYASHPRILDQQSHLQQHLRRRDVLSKQNSINNSFTQLLNRKLISNNIRAFDEHVEARCNNLDSSGVDKADETGMICGITGVKIARTR